VAILDFQFICTDSGLKNKQAAVCKGIHDAFKTLSVLLVIVFHDQNSYYKLKNSDMDL